MENLKRYIAPSTKPIENIPVPLPESRILPNGIPFFYLNMGDQDVCRVDLMIKAGQWDQPRNLVSTFTNLLLKEGAGGLSSEVIAEKLDYYGAWLQLSDTHHYSYITLYTPNRYFSEVLAIMELMLKEPLFPEKEFQTILERRKQQFLIDNEKVQWLSLRGFTNMLFGSQHPYGKIVSADDFDALSLDSLKQFYNDYYHSGNTTVILSGKISGKMIDAVESTFGRSEWGKVKTYKPAIFPVHPATEKKRWINKEDSMQNGIRMGLPVVGRNHPDFNGLRVLNTIFGGYFGSRLMSNIREDKGYTYGISSGITSLKNAAYLTISTQTACENTDPLIREICFEANRLRNSEVGGEELTMVRNYMLGDFARNIDGVFSLADIYISLLSADLPFDYYGRQIEVTKTITSREIQELACKYLIADQFYCAIAGREV